MDGRTDHMVKNAHKNCISRWSLCEKKLVNRQLLSDKYENAQHNLLCSHTAWYQISRCSDLQFTKRRTNVTNMYGTVDRSIGLTDGRTEKGMIISSISTSETFWFVLFSGSMLNKRKTRIRWFGNNF